ncbi:MAG: flagellar M-ring protein FliF [Verrucomicrobia bacterium]|nr:flagellar M-ring protein FliF [Verrucomicrobiota bacterium]
MIQSLRQLGSQLLGIWKQLGLNQKVTVALATTLVLGGLIGLAIWSQRVTYEPLYTRIDDAEAAKVIAALEADKVPHQVGPGGGSILVPSGQVHRLRMQLAGKGLGKGAIVNPAGWELIDRANFATSDFLQRANYLRAVQGELARTIGQLDDVETARVMIVMPENRLLIDQHRKATASVYVKVRHQARLPETSVNAIRYLVANAVEGLQVNHVSVVDSRGQLLSANTEPDSVAGLTASQLALRRQLEQYLGQKVESMLETVLGPGRALVRVAADIDFDTSTTMQTVYDPETVVRENVTKDDKNDTLASQLSQPAGAAANTSTNTLTNTLAGAASSVPLNNVKTSSTTKTMRYEIGQTTTNLVKQPGTIRRLSAAVFVAKRFEGTGSGRKELPLTDKEKESLTKIVRSALGIQDEIGSGVGRRDEITLEEWEFNDQPVLELSLQLEKQQRTQFWLNLARSLLYPLLAGAVLYAFYRALRRMPADSIPIGIPLNELAATGGLAAATPRRGNGHGNGNCRTSPGSSGVRGGDWDADGQDKVVSVEVLNQLIRENPANMTQAVRAWLTRGNSHGR